MSIMVAKSAGFCFGVNRAVELVEQAVKEGKQVFTLGPIIHNRHAVAHFEAMGVQVLDAPEDALPGSTVIIRSHGVGREIYELLKEKNVQIIDATCPVVARLQRRVVEAYEEMVPRGGQVVILGKRGHAEVVGLTGQVEDRAIVVERKEDLEQIDFTRPIFFLSQTTQSIALFEQLGEEILRRHTTPDEVRIVDTICRQVSGREQHLEGFAARFDLVVFVCGRKSSNGKVLFEVCRRTNPRSYNIEEAGELDPAWLEGVSSVGICGATSTPKWLMEQVRDRIIRLTSEH